MSNTEMMHYLLGVEVVQSDTGIFICQKKYLKYVQDVLGTLCMKKSFLPNT